MQNFHGILLLFNCTYYILDYMLYFVFKYFRRKYKSKNNNNTGFYNVYFCNISALYNDFTVLVQLSVLKAVREPYPAAENAFLSKEASVVG